MQNYIGQQIDRYRITERLGVGGMAVVYKAFDTRLERDVALKLIRTESIPQDQHERLLKRFEREAKAQARFSHPNIVPIHDYGEVDGIPYLVMEYVPGGTLKDKLNGPVDYKLAIQWLLPVADALQYAHDRGIIHRDIKPSNILFDETGRPILTDFGIAKILETDEATLTGTGLGVGTPEYMAPEQWQGKPCAASDQYALGVVLYELVTGHKPYTADTPAAIILMQATEPLPAPSKLTKGVPDALEKVLYKALAKTSGNRYEDMAGLTSALQGLLDNAPGKAASSPETSSKTNKRQPSETAIRKESVSTLPIEDIEGETQDALAPVISEGKTNDKTNPQYQPGISTRKKLPAWALWVGFGIVGLFMISAFIAAILNVVNGSEKKVVEESTVDERTTEEPLKNESPGLQMESAMVAEQFFSMDDYNQSLAWMANGVVNPNDPIYLQYLLEDPTSLADYPQYEAKDAPYNICFSNAGVNNPWRVVGYTDMGEQVLELQAEGVIDNFYHYDAQGSDEKQIADIEHLISNPGQCDLLIVSPNTSRALTHIVEEACEVMPVVMFDRYVLTDCPVVKERPIGGYAFGIAGAQFIVDTLGADGGNVLAFRILPGVDVLEQRWGAAKVIFEENPQLNIIGVEFVGYDPFEANKVVTDYLAKYGEIDAVWMDAGGIAVSILEAFEDAGADYPKAMVGEDQNDYLQFWSEKGLNAIAPTFPTYQWRTAILASVMFLQGETVQHNWVLPQIPVTDANLADYYNPEMPPLHYAQCGCEDMVNYPDAWINIDLKKYDNLYN